MHSNLVVTGCDDHQFYIFDTRIPSLIADSKGKEGNTLHTLLMVPLLHLHVHVH